jgi:hypothetical protein
VVIMVICYSSLPMQLTDYIIQKWWAIVDSSRTPV